VNKNKIAFRDIILKKLWGANDFFNRRSMDVIISRLRKHLKNDGSLAIKNVHSKGYILEEL
jgi:DNA-binding response OmpR family regulator